MEKYYLETGVLREISPYLCNKFVRDNCYTSIHSLCELLTDLKNDNEFHVKQKVLNNIFESGIIINWDLPHKIILNSFGLENAYNNISKEEIVQINSIIQKSLDMNSFIKNVNESNSSIYEKICNYDIYYLKGFENEKIRGYNDFQKKYGNIINDKGELEILSKSIKSNINILVSFIIATRMVFANNISKDNININNISPCDLFLNYNGNIDIFIYALGFYSLIEIPFNPNIGKKKKNDFNDIFHLAYIRNTNYFVSRDGLFDKLVKEIFHENIISINDFKNKLSSD
jgi:hypothetical protein